MLSIPNQLEGAYIGQDVVLECHSEAYPDSINYWTTEHGDMIVSGKFPYLFDLIKYYHSRIRVFVVRIYYMSCIFENLMQTLSIN